MSSYITLARQSGLMAEVTSIANNLANLSTTGFRREGVVFSEFVKAREGGPSVSIAAARGRNLDLTEGTMTNTGGTFDFAIRGPGFFMVETPDGERLTRAGRFSPDANGDLVTPSGHRVLDAGGAPVFIPPDAESVSVARDGTISADGRPIGQMGLVAPDDPLSLKRYPGELFEAGGGVTPVDDAVILQGHLEGSNVNPVAEITRMIEVQRAYELGQNFLDRESERRSSVLKTLTR